MLDLIEGWLARCLGRRVNPTDYNIIMIDGSGRPPVAYLWRGCVYAWSGDGQQSVVQSGGSSVSISAPGDVNIRQTQTKEQSLEYLRRLEVQTGDLAREALAPPSQYQGEEKLGRWPTPQNQEHE